MFFVSPFVHILFFISYAFSLLKVSGRLAFAGLQDYNAGMIEIGKNGFVGKKTYEIAYALWQIGTHSSERVFGDKLFDKAIELVAFSADENYSGLVTAIDSLQKIIKFAVDVNAISIPNAAILAREIGNLKSAIPNGNTADINIADIFSSDAGISEAVESELPVDPGSSLKAEVRQSAILEEIRRIGNCRFADVQAILPETSERTIRYDLE